jgi:hypothetical protein
MPTVRELMKEVRTIGVLRDHWYGVLIGKMTVKRYNTLVHPDGGCCCYIGPNTDQRDFCHCRERNWLDYRPWDCVASSVDKTGAD